MFLESPEMYDVILLYFGVAVLLAILFPRFLSRYMVTAPVAYLVLAVLVFSLLDKSPIAHLADKPYLGKRLTEMGVIISLTAAGLKLRHPLAWSTWRLSARLLAITMPLTIAAVAWFGWGILGLAPATAVLLGAVIAPTDPVLASDIQTTPPNQDDSSNARLALTTEAGLNDGLAFPFTNLAIAIAAFGLSPSGWLANWLLNDVLYKILVGVVVGILCGWLLAKIIFHSPKPTGHQSVVTIGILSLSLTLIPYGVAELVHAYGFISVFVAACIFRYQESSREYLDVLHDFSEETERVLVVVLFSMLGVYLSQHFLSDFQWYMVPAALVILLIIRPVSGWIGLLGANLPARKKMIISVFGIRGIGSVYYLMYALHHAGFEQAHEVLAQVMVIIVASVLIHGLSARYVIDKWGAPSQ